jgi:general secretion pathway protein I
MRMAEQQRYAGFTLVEVLVALVIVALGLLAAFGQLSQSVSAATRLRDKTLAHWIATDQLTALRLGRKFPAVGESSDDVEMARSDWRYTIRVTKTPVENLRRVDISVSFADRPNSEVATVTGFLTQPAPPEAGVAGQVADWVFVDPDRPPPPGNTPPPDAGAIQ